jgi:hypothetical protein
MTEADLTLVLRKLDNLITEVRGLKEQQHLMREEVRFMRDDQHLMREELRVVHSTVSRLDDMMRFNVLDRLQALETGKQGA